ncbi:MAG: LysR substrate-binding domain-containing protein [Gammaproteobacteria bacterium]|nr:LysR substrate-binding domain-containing protein [Gammaproteobacteria bacterium]MDH3448322.1 LysR substrate-binding domain-containing protein [Gammaproteobacteria bacterium]
MNLRDLKYIIAVAETHHFGKAAARCFVSQPTLSGQIRKLEDELGVAIFERSNRAVQVTPIGEELLRHARLIIEQAGAMRQLAQAHQDPLAGPLRVGAIPTLSPYLMPLILVPLKRQHPQMKLVLSEETTDTLIARLQHHEIDTALLATAVDEQEFETIALFDEPFWIAHPSDHPFYLKDEITRDDLDNTDLLLLSEGHCLAQQVMDLCHLQERNSGGEMADLRASSLETLLQLVGAGFGSTLVPALAMRGSWTSGSGIVARKLDFEDAHRRVSLVFRKSFPRKQALQVLVQVILQSLPNTVHPLRPADRSNPGAAGA